MLYVWRTLLWNFIETFMFHRGWKCSPDLFSSNNIIILDLSVYKLTYRDIPEYLTKGLNFDLSSPIPIDRDHYQLIWCIMEFRWLSFLATNANARDPTVATTKLLLKTPQCTQRRFRSKTTAECFLSVTLISVNSDRKLLKYLLPVSTTTTSFLLLLNLIRATIHILQTLEFRIWIRIFIVIVLKEQWSCVQSHSVQI